MSENLSEVFTSPIWWITVVVATLLLTVLGNFLTERIKTILSKYSASLRSKKSQRIDEQKKIAFELFTNHSHLFFYLTTLTVKLILALFFLGIGLFSAAAGYVFRVDHTEVALLIFVFALLLVAIALQSLRSIIFNKIYILVFLEDLFQALKNQTPENE